MASSCAVIVGESSRAALRWANSTMTTNGHSTEGSVTVVALVAVDGGVAAGVADSSVAVTDPAQLAVKSDKEFRFLASCDAVREYISPKPLHIAKAAAHRQS